MKQVLFVCLHNSGRSQMAAAFMERLANGVVAVDSAGTMPSDTVNPVVVDAMKEKGLDVSEGKPKLLTQDMADAADRIITMGCSIEEACPATFVPNEDWGLEDPSGKAIEEVRAIRDEVQVRVKRLLAELI
jgi:arsenate reductase